jgi:hypothetical protein
MPPDPVPALLIPNSRATPACVAFCALIHYFFPQSFDFQKIDGANRRKNYELAFKTGERYAGIPDFLTADDMEGMVNDNRLDPKMIFSYVQEVYRMCNEM